MSNALKYTILFLITTIVYGGIHFLFLYAAKDVTVGEAAQEATMAGVFFTVFITAIFLIIRPKKKK
ncbi:MAG: hypothetical protein H6551_08980 [Chitinophagales bacterium]|nr:hypothetical protein [Chitinophagaceae bacterium]MCB9065255.1 hypothetical protein [Chitinophagales bacterium]